MFQVRGWEIKGRFRVFNRVDLIAKRYLHSLIRKFQCTHGTYFYYWNIGVSRRKDIISLKLRGRTQKKILSRLKFVPGL